VRAAQSRLIYLIWLRQCVDESVEAIALALEARDILTAFERFNPGWVAPLLNRTMLNTTVRDRQMPAHL